jgi:hypothetical protein
MRLTILVLSLLLSLGAVSLAQTSSSSVPTASPVTGPSGGMMGQPPAGWPQPHPPWLGPHPQPRRGVRIVDFVLRVLLTLSATFALTALGIFLLRRSGPRS